RNLNLFDSISQSLGNFVATLFTRLNKQHGKLFAADSGSKIDAARAFAQDPTDATYRLVTCIVTKAIVEILELVDVDHQQTERMAKALHTPDFALELPLKSSAICETRQVVRKCRLLTNVEIGFELEQRPGPRQEQIEICRVSDVAQSADLIGPTKIFRAPARRRLHDDGNKLRQRVGPDALGQLVTIHSRHHHVGYHQVRLVRL